MVEIFKVLGVGIVTAMAVILLRGAKPELAFAVTLTGAVIISFFIIASLKNVLSVFQGIVEVTGIENSLIKLLLKIVGVGYVTEFGAGILTDFGSPTIADKVLIGGKLVVILLSLPIMQSLLQLIGAFLEFV